MDFVRIVPAQQFNGLPAPSHRPYAFYADGFSLHGRTIAECYRLVKGVGLPSTAGYHQKENRSPFCWNPFPTRDPEAPLAKLQPNGGGGVQFSEFPLEWLQRTAFVVLGVTLHDANPSLDPFPATWRALSYIVSDAQRMQYRELRWGMSPEQFASARIHALFREVHERSDWGLLAAKTSKRELGLTSFDRIPTPEEEAKFYGYLTTDSGLANQIVGLFGISHRCWHGCGYLGWPTFPLCRFFLLRNLISAGMQVRIMMGSERFLYDPRAEVAGAV